jgi:hypothetical protein
MATGFRNSPKRTIFDAWCSDPYKVDTDAIGQKVKQGFAAKANKEA